jgi:hypothetical protein
MQVRAVTVNVTEAKKTDPAEGGWFSQGGENDNYGLIAYKVLGTCWVPVGTCWVSVGYLLGTCAPQLDCQHCRQYSITKQQRDVYPCQRDQTGNWPVANHCHEN